MVIHNDTDPFPPRRQSPRPFPPPLAGTAGLAIKTMPERGQPAPPEPSPSSAISTVATSAISTVATSDGSTLATSDGSTLATSDGIPPRNECPPTPPPSPVPNSMHPGLASHSFLSKQPKLSEITISLQKTLSNPLPSPLRRAALPPSPVLSAPPAPASRSPEKEKKREKKKEKKKLLLLRPSPSPNPVVALDAVPESRLSGQSTDSRGSQSSTKSWGEDGRLDQRLRSKAAGGAGGGAGGAGSGAAAAAGGGGVRRGGKRGVAKAGKDARRRGLPPPVRRTNSNTAAGSPATEEFEDVEEAPVLPEKVPDAVKRDTERGKRDGSAGGWIVDPDFRTKYINRKQQEAAGRGSPTTALSRDTAVPVRLTRGGRRKDAAEEAMGQPVQPAPPAQRPVLPRQKSQLTVLVEEARKDGRWKADGGGGGGDKGKARMG